MNVGETQSCRAARKDCGSAIYRRHPWAAGGRGGGERGERGEGGRGGVMPERLKSGFGHHRLEGCGPSNRHHKIALDRPDFFAMLRCLPSAIDDLLDTLYEPYAALSQFLGSASMTFFFFSLYFFFFS